MANDRNRINLLRRTAKEVRDYKVIRKILTTVLVLLLIAIAIMFIAAALYKKTGSFTISLNKAEMAEYGLTLAETQDMRYNTSYLNADIVEDITNITEAWLPPDAELDSDDVQYAGAHNGENYIAYTFYMRNEGQTPVSYDYTINLSRSTNDLCEAIRVRLYCNGEQTTYGKAPTVAGVDKDPFVDENFYSSSIVAKKRITDFNPGDQTRFTVVVWIEGEDPECLDWLIGGEVRLDMTMSIVH